MKTTDTQLQKIIDKLKNHEDRIHELEKSILTHDSGHKSKKVSIGENKYTGPTGGVRMLLDNGFFKIKRSLSDVRKNLSDNGYYYSRQAVHEALKILSGKTGPLVSLKEGKGKLYVERK